MTHQFLNDLHVLSVGDEHRRECVSKGMPPNFYGDPGSQCRWANDLLQQGIWPVRILSLSMGARKYPVVGLPPYRVLSFHSQRSAATRSSRGTGLRDASVLQ